MKNGFVPPSGLLESIPKKKISAFNKNFNNTPLRLGVIIKIHEIEDKNNLSKSVVEYDVMTSENNSNLGQGFVRYTNCTSMEGLGGVGDFFEKKLRVSDSEVFSKTYQFSKQNGSLVLILCADGLTEKAIIIGGFHQTKRKTTLTKENGLHMEGEYNGLNWKVDKDGALTVTFRSATDNEGKPQDETAGGSFISIDKTGSVDINPGEGTNIKLDKPAKDISVNAGNNITAKAVKDVTIDAGGKGTVKSVADMLIDCGGSAKFTAKSKINIEATGELEIKGSKIKLESKAKLDIKGKAILLDAPEIDIGKGGTPALITNTMFLGTGNLGAPVLCKAQGPFSSVVYIK